MAVIRRDDYDYFAALDGNGDWLSLSSGPVAEPGDWLGGSVGGDEQIEALRPLVVIDPEDREQVERLERGIANRCGWISEPLSHSHRDAIAAALRSLIEPPKPEEPLGLGAVVEDIDGKRWVRTVPSLGNFNWRSAEADPTVEKWSAVNAVRVLSEGVQ